jgi:regulator of protease activity HflC (stomatin/prohibitin superfamily)
VPFGLRVIRQYERGVQFRLGRLRRVKEPGLRLYLPFADSLRIVQMRTVTLPIEPQQVITKDNVSIGLAAAAYFRRVDPVKSIVEIENISSAIYQIAQTTVRNIVGRSPLDEVLSDTDTINRHIQETLSHTAEGWGVHVERVELKDIQLPQSMQRAMAKQAEAEREKRAKIIAAEGEAESAAKLAEAADIIAGHPIALQLRNLQVLTEIAAEQNSTIVFPAQFMDSVEALSRFIGREQATAGA